jgi:hypothetical protein
MTRFGLLLGGGGTVGIAWETGVLAGLKGACGLNLMDSTQRPFAFAQGRSDGAAHAAAVADILG